MLSSILLPILLFGVLVFIHELGHFLVAKYSGVFVEKFALGFGPTLVRKQWGETEYALCALPLGGYVKMRGEDPESTSTEAAQDPRSFANQGVWTRIAIVIMGPISNLLLPVAVYTLMFMVGTHVRQPIIGSVIPDLPAAQAGLRAGDTILSIDDRPITSWDQIIRTIRSSGDAKLRIVFKRDQLQQTVTVAPITANMLNIYGELSRAGQIGIDSVPFAPVIGISQTQSLAGQAGLKSGDTLLAINQQTVTSFAQGQDILAQWPQATAIDIEVEREIDGQWLPQTFTLIPRDNTWSGLGIEDGSLFVKEVVPDSIADQHGIKPLDKIVSMNDTTIASWHQFRSLIQGNKGEPIAIEIVRDGAALTLQLVPREVTDRDELTRNKRTQRQLGVISFARAGQPATQKVRTLNPVKAMYRGVAETVELTVATLVGIGKLIQGKLSVNAMGGPISIFYLAGTSYDLGGWEAFLRMLAMLSITLAVLNLLPIPILDGGHLFFFVIEVIRGKPVALRWQMWGQRLGLAIILALMALTLTLDFNRFFLDKIKSLLSLF